MRCRVLDRLRSHLFIEGEQHNRYTLTSGTRSEPRNAVL